MSSSPNIEVKEAARLAGLTPARLYQALQAGELEEGPEVKVEWRSTRKARTVKRASLRKWLRARGRDLHETDP